MKKYLVPFILALAVSVWATFPGSPIGGGSSSGTVTDNSLTPGKFAATGTPDNTMYPRYDSAAGFVWATPSGTGDVVGPASATNGGIVLFDNTTGKLVKDSTYTITAAGAALLDDAAASNQRTTLGLGTIATQAADNVAITGGAISGTTIAGVTDTYYDPTSSIQTQIDSKAPIASPTFTGTVTAPKVVVAGTLGGTIDNTVIGGTTPAAATVTTLTFDTAVSTCVPADNNCGQTATNVGTPSAVNLSAGLQWFDNTTNCFTIRNNDNTVTFSAGCQVKTFSFGIDNVVVATDNILLTRVPRAWTITRADCYASTDNVVGSLMECATDNVTSCTVIDSWTVTNAVSPFTDSSMTDGAVASGAWLRWSTESVGTSNSNKLSCTIQYRE